MKYHFVGIGGCGMSGLAMVFHQHGHSVSGSDMHSSDVIDMLGRRNIQVSIGHSSESVPQDCDFVIISAAIPADNPELVRARELNIPILKYAEALGQLSGTLKTVAIAGTHGKSTTSGWTAYAFRNAGLDPSFVIGASVHQIGGGSGAGKGPYLVVESCEYDRSFLKLKPQMAAILNIEADHLDYYKDIDEIRSAFSDFARLPGENGYLIVNAEDSNVMKIVDNLKARCEFFSVGGKAHWQALNLVFESGYGVFDLSYKGESLGRVKLGLPGEFNVANSLAVAALCYNSGIDPQSICQSLENYVGVGRRMCYKGKARGITVMDDYAHHPTEIRVTLDAIRAAYNPARLWCVFQPHQHSRTRFLLDEFAVCFGRADKVLLPDIYFVRDSQQLRREVSAAQLADKINAAGGSAEYLIDFETIINRLDKEAMPGDLVVTMGAGDIWEVADEIICRFGKDN
ncbi:MAG: UDP-N-acetylmuramate--L-alanine ligase [Sedimentisphaerales bacterium]|nr:UDP-N-acetylmuramate--L-alanine ligase [Sedimentisphaerales bacterium]